MQRVRWGTALAYAALIFCVSSIPQEGFPTGLPLNLDKLAHVTEYGILAFLVCRAVEKRERSALILIVLFCAAYGVLDELYQSLIPGRASQVWDAAADAVGSLAGTAFWMYRKRRSARPLPRSTPK